MAKKKLKRRSDGRFVCYYHGRAFYGKTEKEALEARDAVVKAEAEGMQDDRAVTVRTYAAQWLPIHKANVSRKTYNDYAKQIDALIDVVGDKRPAEVKASDVKAVWLHFAGYSASTIRRARMLYISLFDTAIEDGFARVNPCKGQHAQPPKASAGTHRAITDDERRLIDEADGDPFWPCAMVMLYAGLRRGEALALDVDRDVDFINHCIHVRYAIRFDKNRPILCDPKTEAGSRDVPMIAALEDILRPLRGLVAPNRTDGGLMSETAFRRSWARFILSIECKINHAPTKSSRFIPPDGWKAFTVRPHDLRHSYCTMLRDAGVDLHVAMMWLGHADEKMILKVYDHVTARREAQAVASVEKLLDDGQNDGQNEINTPKSVINRGF